MTTPSWALVALQFALIAVLVATTRPLLSPIVIGISSVLLVAGGAPGLAALAANRPGNFNIRPEIRDQARLVTHGIYARVRHPMYGAVLLVMLVPIVVDPRLWRVGAWIALLAVLLVKAMREERYLQAHFADYADYRRRAGRLIPRIF
jgi:protein-S-isoprenylcysteine O-methyltransferase Ste14